MSHTNTYEAKIKNADRFMEVARTMGATNIRIENHNLNLYGSNTVECIASCKLPGWRYHIGVTQKGEIAYDHWGSESNTMDLLGQTVQNYWVDEVNQAIDWTEVQSSNQERLNNGDIEITLEF